MTTTTNFKISDGTDLGYVFYPVSLGGSSYSTNTGFVSGTNDFKNIFQVKGDASGASITGFKLSSGADLNTIFRNINYPIIHNTTTTSSSLNLNKIELSNNGNLCFCFSTDSTTGNKYIQYSSKFKTTQQFTNIQATYGTKTVISSSSFTNVGILYIFYILESDQFTDTIRYYTFNPAGSGTVTNGTLTLSTAYPRLLLCSVSSNGTLLAVGYFDGVNYGIHFIENFSKNVIDANGRNNTNFLYLGLNSRVDYITCSSVSPGAGVFLISNILYTFSNNTGQYQKNDYNMDVDPYILSNEINVSNEGYVNIVCINSSSDILVRRYKIIYQTGSNSRAITLLGTKSVGLKSTSYTANSLNMFNTINFIMAYSSSNTGGGGLILYSNNVPMTYTGMDDFIGCETSIDTTTNEIVMVGISKNSKNIYYTTAIDTTF